MARLLGQDGYVEEVMCFNGRLRDLSCCSLPNSLRTISTRSS
ncbi:hypothetical protein JMJ77_0010305 [Colletotrichum scovillei]|uniref:Uncharacterized protein n=1 Tax=Colletotrichum scovillei TaxID=1209932 RepID=A0A9P7QTD1_9PEZI|nr:hypothetical protein JMJ78_0011682 [Colletotrichum scovillei]KAG7042203.1 hypothetical protein JMJ77_0010305 [Colletotrichum scovillei]KAG7062236.1 hypothetical protein JMJ76_0006513 [Colletotrichum scovillei]